MFRCKSRKNIKNMKSSFEASSNRNEMNKIANNLNFTFSKMSGSKNDTEKKTLNLKPQYFLLTDRM